MSAHVSLVVRDAILAPLDVEGVSADRLSTLSALEIAHVPVWAARQRARLGDFFHVRGERAAAVRIEGDVRRVSGLAAGMLAGTFVIDGDAGNDVAAEMSGGTVEVLGSAGDDAGVGMRGGTLVIRGDAGNRVGAARPGAARGMSGGEIVVHGRAGEDVAAVCRRGLIVVGGDVGGSAGRAMIAGSLVVAGRIGPGAARFNKRGSVIALGDVDVPSTYRYACTYRPPHVRLMLTYVARKYERPFASQLVSGQYRRYCGDLMDPGRGEILAWVSP